MSTSDSLQAQIQHAQTVQEKYSDELLSKPHVVGLAVGFTSRTSSEPDPFGAASDSPREVCLVVMVDEIVDDENLPEADRIPLELEGVPVEIQRTGLFTAGFSAE
jgi:hypothetical protein